MKSTIKSIVSFALAVAVTISLAACGENNDAQSSNATITQSETVKASTETEKKEIRTLSVLMETEKDNAGWQAMMKDFESKTDTLALKLEVEKFPGKDSTTIFKTRFATGNIPDILVYNSATAAKSDLRGEFADISGDWTKNYDPTILKSLNYTIDGKLCGAPLGGTNLNVVMYNKKVFSELGLQIPNNWDELIAVCEKIKAAGKVPMYFSGKDSWTLQLFAFLGVHRDGKAFGSTADLMQSLKDRKSRWQDLKLFQDSMAKMKELKEKGFTNKNVISDTYDLAQKELVEGTAAMYVMGGWIVDELVKKYPDKVNDIGSFALSFNDNTDKAGAFLPPCVLVTTNEDKKKEEGAKEFINYFASLETQTIYFQANPGIPCLKGLQRIKLTAPQEDMYKIIESGRAEDNWQTSGAPYSPGDLAKYLQDLMVGVKTPEQICETMQSEWDKDAKAKGYPGY